MVYLWSLHGKQDLAWFSDRSRVEAAMKELQHGYQQHFAGDEVSVLGGQVIEQPLPTGPDEFVVATCLMLCKKNRIPFKSDRDEISYSVDVLDGNNVGVCRIRVQAGRKPWWQFWK